ncbi:hypothetical protein M885DRAFT_449057, partial [Pelagophyceae sp. CCMP2097]
AELTIAYLYYRDVGLMKKHIASWQAFPAPLLRRLNFLIIDDGSPPGERAAEIVGGALCGARVLVVEVLQDVAWNIGGARNLIFTVAPTEVILMVDADQMLPVDLVEWALRRAPTTKGKCEIVRGFPRKLLSGRPFRVHPGVMLASRDSYWRVGGCDEDFVGQYGHTDVHFNQRVEQTAGCGILQAADLPIRGRPPSLIYLEDPRTKTKFYSRDNSRNKALFEAKMAGQKPWSRDTLRFNWTLAVDSAAHCTFV